MKTINPKTDGYIADKVLDDFEDDQIAVRGVISDDGRKFIIKAKDPHGLWEITPRKGGTVPEALKGLWTSTWDAEQAIIRYCASHPVREKYYKNNPVSDVK